VMSSLSSRLHRSLFASSRADGAAGTEAGSPAWDYYWRRFAEEHLAESIHGDPGGYLQSLGRSEPIRVLSLRSGSGQAELEMARRFRVPYEITCAGEDPEAFQGAREAAAEESLKVTFHRTDHGWRSLPDRTFDLVLSNAALHDAEDLDEALDRIAERVAPDGILQLVDVDAHRIDSKALAFAEAVVGLLPETMRADWNPSTFGPSLPPGSIPRRLRASIGDRFEPLLEVRHGAIMRFLCGHSPVGGLDPTEVGQKPWLDLVIDLDRSVVRSELLEPLELWGVYRQRPSSTIRGRPHSGSEDRAYEPAGLRVIDDSGVGRRFDPQTHGPSTLFLAMSTSNICNFRCKHCHIWMNEDDANELTTDERVEVVREFAGLSGGGTVVLPGGEVTLDYEELFALSGACRDLGLACVITTNGSGVRSAKAASAIAASGITAVTVSLDSHRKELHEYTRGVPGCFEATVAAIRHLVAAKSSAPGPFRVMVSSVVFDRNVEELEDYVTFCRDLGVDHVDLQMLSRTFSNRHPRRDVFFERHFWHSDDARKRAKQALWRVLEAGMRSPGFLLKGLDSFDWMSSYIDDPDFRTTRPICGSHERNLVVSTKGDVTLCFNASQIFDEPSIGNVRRCTLAEIWAGHRAADYREEMDECRLNCGALNCHRRQATVSLRGIEEGSEALGR